MSQTAGLSSLESESQFWNKEGDRSSWPPGEGYDDERGEPVGQDVRRDPLGAGEELTEVPGANEDDVAQDEQCPVVA